MNDRRENGAIRKNNKPVGDGCHLLVYKD
jgi:hypothetical protein